MTQGVLYLVAGAAINVAVLAIYYTLSLGGLLHPALALPVASLAGVVIGFAAHGRYTFRGSHFHGPALAKYAATYAWSALFQWGFLMLFHGLFGFHHAIIVLVGLGGATAMSFLLQRDWVFGARG